MQGTTLDSEHKPLKSECEVYYDKDGNMFDDDGGLWKFTVAGQSAIARWSLIDPHSKRILAPGVMKLMT